MRTRAEIEADIIHTVHNYRMCHKGDKKTNRARLFKYDKELTALNHIEADKKTKAAGK